MRLGKQDFLAAGDKSNELHDQALVQGQQQEKQAILDINPATGGDHRHQPGTQLGVAQTGWTTTPTQSARGGATFATTALVVLRKQGQYVAPEQQEAYQDVLQDIEEGIARVKNIVRELNNEKVDIIRWTQDTRELVLEALRPAKVKSLTLDEARKHPLKLSYGTSGVGNTLHMSVELMSSMTDTKMTHIPYKGPTA